MTTRRQHYVWRAYLAAWAKEDGQVLTVRSGSKPFSSNSMNIAVQRDFYRMGPLTENDERLISQFIDHAITNEMLKDLARGWLRTFALPSRIRRLMVAKGIADEELEALLTKAEIETEENIHGGIESDAAPLLVELRGGSTDFWFRDNDARDFAFFIALQHLRTKRMQDVTLAKLEQEKLQVISKSGWPIMRFILATTFGWSIYSQRRLWDLRILRATGDMKFITSDQPTINLMTGTGDDDLALFYPVSPERAVTLELKTNAPIFQSDALVDADVHSLNLKMAQNSHEAVFGVSQEYLSAISTKKSTRQDSHSVPTQA